MSKPESAGAKSLEEILSSIRKSLTEGTAEPAPAAQSAPVSAAHAQPKPASPANAPAKGSGPLADKPPGALNGSARGSGTDADLNDLLAAEPKKPNASPPVPSDKPADSGGGEKDPLWFLSRLSAAAAGPAPQGSAARARDAAKAPAAPAEDIKLSRPETLRPSLPPLFEPFGANSPAASPKPADTVSKTARTEPRVLRQDGGANGGKEETAPTESADARASQSAPPSPAKEGPSAGQTSPRPTLSIDPAPAAEPVFVPRAEARESPAPPAGPEATSVPESASTPEQTAAEANPAGMDGLQPRALEQTLADLLEPVIRQWLQKNLPSLIETVVREEVAKAVAAERAAGKV
jgi:cell pole-organizing protein PopZ